MYFTGTEQHRHKLKNYMEVPTLAVIAPPRFTFRPGALDAIMRSRNLQTEEQLALLIGVYPADIPKLRAGAKVTAELALRVAALQGDKDYIAAWFDRVDEQAA
ncbi:hypothetical protein [Corynebacterium accolens]|uniref:hypothetical protein n=1 Tax=Corynebacterium accolens TaxID=38284 RepID=UPI002543B8FA|nr:hypothetical protein [Corynebacterium accolens]MDK4337256.1 hypothetical protein [Corynebacterium accolens]